MPVTKKTKTIKKKVTVKTTPKSEPAPVASEPAPVASEPTPVASEPAPVASESVPETDTVLSNSETPSLNEEFDELTAQLDLVLGSVKGLRKHVKALQKRSKKELLDAQKRSRKRKNTNSDPKQKRAPSGFAKPSEISKSLCDFLGKPIGTEMARTDVTKFITEYIRKNSLQNPENKRHIIPDAKLGNLLDVKNNEVVTYFNLQKYMKHHFPKSAAALAKEATAK